MPISNNVGSDENWQLINANHTALANTRIFNFATNDISLTTPSTVLPGQEIEIHNFSSASRISINLQGNKYLGASYSPGGLVIQGNDKRVALLYINEANGWYPILGSLDIPIPPIVNGNYLTWLLTETAGTQANDVSNSSRTGVFVNCTLSATGAVFNGTDSRVSQNTAINALTAYSIGMDFQTSSASNQGLWEFRASQDLSSGVFAPGLIMNSSGRISLYGFPQSSIATTQSYNDGNFHRILCLISTSNVKIFINKTKVIDQNINPIANFSGFFSVGSTRAGGTFNGKLRNFRIWNSLLTEAQAIEYT